MSSADSVVVAARFSRAEKLQARAVAAAQGLTLSHWLRRLAVAELEAAEAPEHEAGADA